MIIPVGKLPGGRVYSSSVGHNKSLNCRLELS